MTDMVERVARATLHAECEPHKAETGYGDTWGDWLDVMPAVRERHLAMARAAIEASGYATLEAALRTIQSVIPGYLKQKMTAEDFALIVIGAVDNGKVNKALEKGR